MRIWTRLRSFTSFGETIVFSAYFLLRSFLTIIVHHHTSVFTWGNIFLLSTRFALLHSSCFIITFCRYHFLSLRRAGCCSRWCCLYYSSFSSVCSKALISFFAKFIHCLWSFLFAFFSLAYEYFLAHSCYFLHHFAVCNSFSVLSSFSFLLPFFFLLINLFEHCETCQWTKRTRCIPKCWWILKISLFFFLFYQEIAKKKKENIWTDFQKSENSIWESFPSDSCDKVYLCLYIYLFLIIILHSHWNSSFNYSANRHENESDKRDETK